MACKFLFGHIRERIDAHLESLNVSTVMFLHLIIGLRKNFKSRVKISLCRVGLAVLGEELNKSLSLFTLKVIAIESDCLNLLSLV